MTEQLALMLKALWACQYHPELSTTFKAIVERHGSQFKGTQQQDAQEFLQWLLDKVHEDLNTASKKKYKPIKVSRLINKPNPWLNITLFFSLKKYNIVKNTIFDK